jgi:Cys-tRNA(Pro) deacylase
VKTLIARGDERHPLCVLMHGDMKMSAKDLARQLGFKNVAMCAPDDAQRLTGYMVGGTSPFGMKTALPVHVEESILELPRIYINGGGRGLLVEIDPAVLVSKAGAIVVNCGRPS